MIQKNMSTTNFGQTNNQARKLKLVAFQAIAGVILFLILSTINMIIYPGSFHVNYHVFPYDHYSFIYNNLSDMGMFYTFTGEPNFTSAALFTITLTLTGISFFIFVRYFPLIFNPASKSYKLARLGSILGIISSIAFIGVGWTPWDKFIVPHMLFVSTAFLFSILFNIFFAIAILRNKLYPNWFAIPLLSYALIIIGYILALALGPSYITLSGRVVESLGQKIVIYAQMIFIIINAIGYLIVIERKTRSGIQ
jgi:hypothetical protein